MNEYHSTFEAKVERLQLELQIASFQELHDKLIYLLNKQNKESIELEIIRGDQEPDYFSLVLPGVKKPKDEQRLNYLLAVSRCEWYFPIEDKSIYEMGNIKLNIRDTFEDFLMKAKNKELYPFYLNQKLSDEMDVKRKDTPKHKI